MSGTSQAIGCTHHTHSSPPWFSHSAIYQLAERITTREAVHWPVSSRSFMATLTQPTQRRGKSVQYGNHALDDEGLPTAGAGTTRVDVADTEDEVHLQHRRTSSHLSDPYAHLDDPRMGNKGELYALPSNGGKVHGPCRR